jgi:hypothetical protein
MKNVSLIWTFLIAAVVFESAACNHSDPPDIETRTLSASETARQIELLNAVRPNEFEGKRVDDFPELFSLADEICSKNGKINRYVFHRKGEGGNDDGSDSIAFVVVKDGVIQSFGFLVVPS